MGFKAYNYKFRFNILHCAGEGQNLGKAHAHTLELSLLLKTDMESPILYNVVEKTAEEYLARYSGKLLNEVPPFDTTSPTIENIGDFLFSEFKTLLIPLELDLTRLDISETPTRVYTVVERESPSNDEELLRDRRLVAMADDVRKNLDYETLAAQTDSEEKKLADKPLPKQPADDAANQDIFIEKPSAKRYGFGPVLAQAVLVLAAGGLVWYIQNSGLYPLGFDIYGHLFKADMLYNSIKSGDFYPLYTLSWYNGMQPFRYWAPLPYYILAGLEFLTGGNVMTAFLLFVGLAFFAGAVGWVMWGVRHGRLVLCTVLGILWFFLPDNARVFFSEGNFPRMVIAAMIPYWLYSLWGFVHYKKKSNLIAVIFLTGFITLCHAMLGAMAGIAAFVFLACYAFSMKRYRESVQLLTGMILSFALCGIWLVPALSGGIASMDSTEIMTSLSTALKDSLNPLVPWQGDVGFYYFGLSVFLLSVLGLFVSGRKSKAGFLSALVFLLGTTTALTPILVKLPLSQVLWMRRFTLIAYALFFLSMIEWKELKKGFTVAFCALLIVDSVPTFNLAAHLSKFIIPVTASTQEEYADTYSFTKAKEVTSQRISLMDLSAFGPFPSYALVTGADVAQYTFGWAWQGAATANNIVMLNTALEGGYFNYLFDRSIEMGDDTVVFRKEQFKNPQEAFESLEKAAALSGYTLVENGEYAYVYSLGTKGNFGVISQYDHIAIGKSASEICMFFPGFQQGDSLFLDAYSFEELKDYSVIYLSGFQYNSKSDAEALVKQLTESGVRVIIDMNRIPVNTRNNTSEFMDVTAQPIVFSDRYPELVYEDTVYTPSDFDEEFVTWNTVYLDGVEQVQGYSWFKNQQLAFAGTKGNENTVFMGFNLLYHAMETGDGSTTMLLRDFLETDENTLPDRKIVPIQVNYDGVRLTIESPEDHVNTTLAYQDNFQSTRTLQESNHLLTVEKGITEIRMTYPYKVQGIVVSLLGLAGTALLLRHIYKKKKL